MWQQAESLIVGEQLSENKHAQMTHYQKAKILKGHGSCQSWLSYSKVTVVVAIISYKKLIRKSHQWIIKVRTTKNGKHVLSYHSSCSEVTVGCHLRYFLQQICLPSLLFHLLYYHLIIFQLWHSMTQILGIRQRNMVMTRRALLPQAFSPLQEKDKQKRVLLSDIHWD